MELTSARAVLVGARDVDAQDGGVTATVPREEFESALASEQPEPLFLEVARAAEDADAETRTVAVEWNRTDLERILGESSADEITLAFGPAELARALAAPDVEAHGFREAALVLSVAAVTATAGAPLASAGVAEGTGTGTVAAQSASAIHDESSLTARGLTPEVGIHDESSLAARGITPDAPRTIHDEASLAARGITPEVRIHDESSLAARGVTLEPPRTIHDESSLVARGITPEPASGDEGWAASIPAPDAGTAATIGGIAGGVGLVILAAGFGARRHRAARPA
jgi:hypothetical protein